MLNSSSKISLRHGPLADYIRKRQDSKAVRSLGVLLRTWRNLNPKPVRRVVPMESLLCGGEQGLSAAQYARHTGNFLRPSTPFSRSPHVQFLEQYKQVGDEIFRPEVFRQTAYFANATECMNVTGHYFDCTREEQLIEVARNFIAQFRSGESNGSLPRSGYFSAPGSMVEVRQIEFSLCYEVVDGNHRLAIAYVRGERAYPVLVRPEPARTPLQQLIMDYSWCALRNVLELYQPIESPELGQYWTLVRRCTDRFEMMRDFLSEHQLLPPVCRSYLDIACSYGWFVRQFDQLGFDAHGVEIDWAAIEIGQKVYGLKPGQVTRSEVVRFLESDESRYDIVSCFSLLHHFVIGRGSKSAEEVLRMVDEKTGKVLFFDMGQEHEAWFRESLAGWNADHIEEWLRQNSSFKHIYRLGVDQDNVPPFADNYGRTMFACLR